MTRLRVIVKKLNKRNKIPLFLPDPDGITGVVNEHFIFDGEEVIDVPNPALGKWYRDRNGHFYWGEGLAIVIDTAPPIFDLPPTPVSAGDAIQFDQNKMSWGHRFCSIPFIWNDLKASGQNVTVAVIDTGIDETHEDLVDSIHPLSKNIIQNGAAITDSDGHGTGMAGIIGATGKNKVFGVALGVKLLIIKVMQEVRGADPKLFAKALDFVSTIPEVDIVSISGSFLVDDQDLKTSVQTCLAANKIIVSAIGNLRDFIGIPDGPDKDTFPACYNGVIAVGAHNQSGEVLKNISCWNQHLSLIAPGDFSILTTGLGNTTKMGKATSIATAFTSGCLALILSYAKQHAVPVEECVEAILSTCDDIGEVIGRDIQSGHGRINLRNAVTKIKRP